MQREQSATRFTLGESAARHLGSNVTGRGALPVLVVAGVFIAIMVFFGQQVSSKVNAYNGDMVQTASSSPSPVCPATWDGGGPVSLMADVQSDLVSAVYHDAGSTTACILIVGGQWVDVSWSGSLATALQQANPPVEVFPWDLIPKSPASSKQGAALANTNGRPAVLSET